MPLDFPVAVETGCAHMALVSAPLGPMHPCWHPQRLPTSEPGRHSAGASAASLLGHWEWAGRSVWTVLPHFLVVQPAMQTGERRARGASWSHDEHEMIFLAETSEWKGFLSD